MVVLNYILGTVALAIGYLLALFAACMEPVMLFTWGFGGALIDWGRDCWGLPPQDYRSPRGRR